MISTSKLGRYCIAVFALLLGLFGPGKAIASHFAAVDLHVDYIGTGPGDYKYQIYLIVYRACDPGSIELSTQESVTYSSSCAAGGSVLLPTVIGPDTVDQLCPGFQPINQCRVSGSPWPAFIRRTYSAQVTLPVACADWKFVWTNSARNGGITNLCQPSSQSITVTCQLNNVLHYDNSSPKFIVDPIPYFCINQNTYFYNGPLDVNADSLRTVAWNPLGCGACSVTPCGPNTEIPYIAPYTLANPFNSSNGYTVDSVTGIANFTPVAVGKYVIAFRVYEFDRNTGTMLGFTTRDVQVAVLNCNSGPPLITPHPINVTGATLDTSGGNTIIACPGSPISFQVNATSQTLSNAVYMTAGGVNTALGMAFNVTGQGQGSPTGTFTWTPNFNDIGNYTLSIEAKDSTCNNNQPIIFRSYQIVYIRIIPGVNAGPDKYGYCALNGAPIDLSATGSPFSPYSWTNLLTNDQTGISNGNTATPSVVTNQTTSYEVQQVNLPVGCKTKDTVVVNIDNSNSITITPASPFILCRPGYMNLTSVPAGPPPLTNLPCGTVGTVSNTVLDSATITIPYTASGPNGSPNNISSSPFYGSAFYSARHQYLLKQPDLIGSGLHSGTLTGMTFFLNGFGSGTATFNNFTVKLKCVTKKYLTNDGTGTGSITWESGTTQVYTGTVSATSGTAGVLVPIVFDTPYNWDTTQNIVVELCYYNTALTQNVYTNSYNVGNGQSLYYGSTSATNICATATTPLTAFEIPQIKFNNWDAPPAPFEIKWNPGTFLSDSTSATPTAYIPGTTKYVVYTKGRNNCIVRDSITVIVPVHNYRISPIDTSICLGEPVRVFGLPNVPVSKYEWYEVDGFGNFVSNPTSIDSTMIQGPIITPKAVGTFKYAVVITDPTNGSTNCLDTLFTTITVMPLPDVHVLNNDTTIKYSRSLQLLVTGGYLYTWYPVGSLSDPNTVNPIATPTEPTMYYVVGIGQNGCRSMDSVKVNIDYRDNLFVPTAFTPNGDGKNDRFRVTNLSFQKIMEFRIFNRWGQEVYSATDNNGWDGKWKGVTQEMGTYRYIIRVGYPDSYVETYKGDVTLVR